MQQLKFVEDDVPSDSDDEGIAQYKIGGYHPAFIGEVFHNRYVVIHKLGWGQFSTVWIAKDFKTQLYVALKIQKSAPKSFETALDEVEILQRIQKKGALNIVRLLNTFMIQGPFGNHLILVFELLGVSLQEVIKTYQGLTFDQCRSILRQILIALDFLHRVCGLIHTDIKPENILICLGQEQIQSFVDQGQLSKRQKRRLKQRQHEESHLCQHHRQQQKRLLIKIADLGNACWVHHHFSEVIQTLPYRAPEVTLGAYYGTSVDIWSMGCLAFELVTGEVLFKETDNESHLLKIHNMIGSLKGYVGKYSKQYQPLFRESSMSLEKVLKNKYQIEGGFCDFLRAMLEIKPYERATAEQLLAHPWLNGGNTIRRLRKWSESSREEETESD